MKIVLLVEGATEKAFLPKLQEYLKGRLDEVPMPKITASVYDGRIPTGEKLRRTVKLLLADGTDLVIALSDVYTGSQPPAFANAADAKSKMRQWVGEEPKFVPHVAQHDFESWLIPYWPTIQKLAKHNQKRPPGDPEKVNHGNPPARRLREMFEIGKCRDSYVKPRDAKRILSENSLDAAVSECAELRALVNTILTACGGDAV